MARRSTGPRWFDSEKAYFTTINKVRHNLGSDLVQATRKFSELTLRAPTVNPSMKIGDLIDAFLAAKQADWKPGTLELRQLWLRRFKDRYGDTPWSELIPYHVLSCRKPDWGNNTMRILISSVKSCLTWAKDAGLISVNPLADLKRPPAVFRSDQCIITEEQAGRMLCAAPEALQYVLDALWHTGNRPGYIITVEARECVDGTWVCGPKPGRKMPKAVIYLNEYMRELTLRNIGKYPEGPIFRNSWGKPWSYDVLKQAIRETRTRAGIKGLTAYWYRHTYGRRMIDVGTDYLLLATLMNTSVEMLTRVYGHQRTLTDRLRAACQTTPPRSPSGPEARPEELSSN